jgi:hypothetical protein
MAVNLSPLGGAGAQFFDNSGNVLTGGRLYTYIAGTTTPAVTYTTNLGTTPHSNPIVLNAAGRVPDSGEIWLTDGILYKFVLKDSNEVQLATWDNIDGINSNFLAYTTQNEVQTATQGQTIFTLVDFTYQPATDSLAVFVNGSKQVLTLNYAETSATVVTFVDGLNVGDVVQFTTASPVATNVTTAANVSFTGFKGQTGNVQNLADDDGADWIGFTADDVDAVAISAQDKMQQIISVKDFGATGDGVSDDTNAIQTAIDAVPVGSALYFPTGTYLITSTLNVAIKAGNVSGLILYGDGLGTVVQADTDMDAIFYVTGAQTNFRDIQFATGSNNVSKGLHLNIGNYADYSGNVTNCLFYDFDYGIYANGLLVETCSKRYLKDASGMTLIE